MLIYRQMGSGIQLSMEFEWRSLNSNWKCCLQNIIHFIVWFPKEKTHRNFNKYSEISGMLKHKFVSNFKRLANIPVMLPAYKSMLITLQWRHDGHDSVTNHQPHDCLLNRLFRCRSKKTSKLHVTGFFGDRWIPRINGHYRGKCFHLMTSSCD